MAYCREVDIKAAATEAVVKRLTDDTSGLTIDSNVLNQAIAWADDRINGSLRAQHTVPITPVPNVVKQLSVDLTVYRLYSRRIDRGIPESIENLFDTNEKYLDKIQKGTIQLSDSTAYANTGSMFVSSKSSTSQVYTDTRMDEYFDPDDM